MVEAMYEFSPDYFKKLQKPFRYFTCKQLPDFSSSRIKNFAYGFHNSTHIEHCNVDDYPHYHVIMDGECNSDFLKGHNVKTYAIPCLLTCYKILICSTSDAYVNGEIMEKLQKAVEFFDGCQNDMFSSSKVNSKRLPQTQASPRKRSATTQTTMIPQATLERMCQLLTGQNASEFLLIMDIFESGYGALNVNNDSIVINFDLEKIGKKYTKLK